MVVKLLNLRYIFNDNPSRRGHHIFPIISENVPLSGMSGARRDRIVHETVHITVHADFCDQLTGTIHAPSRSPMCAPVLPDGAIYMAIECFIINND